MDDKKNVKPPYERPYDDSILENWPMYDNMPYVWDRNLIVDKHWKSVSGNIIKSYRCIMKDPYEIKYE